MPKPRKSIRILLIDPHVLMRAGLRLLIEKERHLSVVGEAGDRKDGLELASRERPDVILLTVDSGGESVLDFLPDLIAAGAGARVLLLCGECDPEVHRRAIHLGAMGLVLKHNPPAVLMKAIEKVHDGEAWLDRSLMARVLSERSNTDKKGEPNHDSRKIASLTDREREVVGYVCQGLKNKQIADRLFISEATVRNHVTSILSKLELKDRFELALYAYSQHLAKPPG